MLDLNLANDSRSWPEGILLHHLVDHGALGEFYTPRPFAGKPTLIAES